MAEQPHCAFCKRPLTGGAYPSPFEADDGGTTCSPSPTGRHERAGVL